jgi:hypothetical protein
MYFRNFLLQPGRRFAPGNFLASDFFNQWPASRQTRPVEKGQPNMFSSKPRQQPRAAGCRESGKQGIELERSLKISIGQTTRDRVARPDADPLAAVVVPGPIVFTRQAFACG